MDNRGIILKAAVDLFYARGYDAVGVQEIAEKAGLTKPTLYYYFGSKQGLLESLLKEGFTRLEERIRRVLDKEQNIPDKLYGIAREYFDFAAANRKFYLLMLSLFYAARENEAYQTVAPYIERHYRQMVGLFEQGADELGNMNGRQEQFAISFIGYLNHYIMMVGYSAGDGEIVITDEDTYQIVKQFMYGIYS